MFCPSLRCGPRPIHLGPYERLQLLGTELRKGLALTKNVGVCWMINAVRSAKSCLSTASTSGDGCDPGRFEVKPYFVGYGPGRDPSPEATRGVPTHSAFRTALPRPSQTCFARAMLQECEPPRLPSGQRASHGYRAGGHAPSNSRDKWSGRVR